MNYYSYLLQQGVSYNPSLILFPAFNIKRYVYATNNKKPVTNVMVGIFPHILQHTNYWFYHTL